MPHGPTGRNAVLRGNRGDIDDRAVAHGAHQDAQKLIQRMEFQRLGICIESRQ
jgi:hypothetical protein